MNGAEESHVDNWEKHTCVYMFTQTFFCVVGVGPGLSLTEQNGNIHWGNDGLSRILAQWVGSIDTWIASESI